MEYQGYKDRAEIFSLVEKHFPYVRRPKDEDLTLFGDDDWVCKFLKEHMHCYRRSALPLEGVRYLHNELANLSPQGMAWFLPSLLRKAILSDKNDTLSEFLIYELEYSEERFENIKRRYALLSPVQLRCLAMVLEFFSEQHGHAIALALQTIDALHA